MTQNQMIILSLAVSLSLSGCSGGGSSNDFAAALKENTNMPDDVANCFAELAEEELSDDARAFLIAGMSQDETATTALREKLSFVELTQAGLFMASAGGRCGIPELEDE